VGGMVSIAVGFPEPAATDDGDGSQLRTLQQFGHDVFPFHPQTHAIRGVVFYSHLF